MIQWKELTVEMESTEVPFMTDGKLSVPCFVRIGNHSIGCFQSRNHNTNKLEYEVKNGEWSIWMDPIATKNGYDATMNTPDGTRKLKVQPVSFVEFLGYCGADIFDFEFELWKTVCKSQITLEMVSSIQEEYSHVRANPA
jgi:hypothetical protein